ncbi:hypothetical protein HUU05_23295 [candidate division KSB1 bacterium]|nr:hypothetical protein [candidate division KSB1 bacterium]
MIQGTIENGLHSRLRLKLESPTGPLDFKALIDSGFDGQVALPYFAADKLRLELARFVEVTYANGQSVAEVVRHGVLHWHDKLRAGEVILSDDGEPAIGTDLMQGCVVTMDFIQNVLQIDKSAA